MVVEVVENGRTTVELRVGVAAVAISSGVEGRRGVVVVMTDVGRSVAAPGRMIAEVGRDSVRDGDCRVTGVAVAGVVTMAGGVANDTDARGPEFAGDAVVCVRGAADRTEDSWPACGACGRAC